MSPWMVDFARQTFEVPMLQGPIEEQHIVPGTLDAIALMDVLEHLPDPVGTLQHCLRLLRPDGLLIIQTPCFPAGKTYAEMVTQEDRFLEQLKENEHLYLFSQGSIREFFSRLGANYLQFAPAIFAYYDMFLVVSCTPLAVHPPEAHSRALSATASGRMIQALLDTDDRQRELQQRSTVAEADRVARQAVIEQQGHEISQLQAQGQHWLQENQSLRQHLEAAEADRAARLLVVEQQGKKLSGCTALSRL